MHLLLLQGKDKPTYTPNQEDGDVVVVTNARHVEFTGRKWDNKVYRWHTGRVLDSTKEMSGRYSIRLA